MLTNGDFMKKQESKLFTFNSYLHINVTFSMASWWIQSASAQNIRQLEILILIYQCYFNQEYCQSWCEDKKYFYNFSQW